MATRETAEQAAERWQKLELLQDYYKEFDDFLIDVIEDVMGFTCTDIQIDIGRYLAHGPQYRMVQAQRGQAKTTITAAYAVWRIIHEPSTRVLIVSAGEDMAVEIGNWIIQILNNMDELECLRADRTNGDRASVEAYDVHYTLKGPEKSPSIRSMGITANLQGKRADIIIADDVESQKNSQTDVMRTRLELLTKDFASICSNGDIIYLGTPQSVASIYNGLPGRGYDIRIWPGRFPTLEEEKGYGAFLAPLLVRLMMTDPSLRLGGGPTGNRGQPIDPSFMTEAILTKKETDQGPSYFQLQHMLSTALADADRFPLKPGDLRILAWDRIMPTAPMQIQFSKHQQAMIPTLPGFSIKEQLYRVMDAREFGQVSHLTMYVDPAGGGQNGDELAVAITGMCAGRVYVYDVDGIKGGLGEEQLVWLTAKVMQWPEIRSIRIEKNFGNGALRQVWQPKLLEALKEKGRPPVCLEDVWESGQKELRIIDILEPVIGAGKLILHEDLLDADTKSIQKYPAELRKTYSLFFQMSRITRDKGALAHDDRLDALAGSVRAWVEALAIDDAKAVAKAANDRYQEMMKNPLGDGRPLPLHIRQAMGDTSLAAQGTHRRSMRQPGRVAVYATPRGNRF